MARREVLVQLDDAAGRRPVRVVTRNAAIAVLTSVTCAPITRTIRGIRSEVGLDEEHGLPEACAIVVRAPASRGINVNTGAGFPEQETSVFLIKGASSPSVDPYNPNWTP